MIVAGKGARPSSQLQRILDRAGRPRHHNICCVAKLGMVNPFPDTTGARPSVFAFSLMEYQDTYEEVVFYRLEQLRIASIATQR